jgi:hypothetical protein
MGTEEVAAQAAQIMETRLLESFQGLAVELTPLFIPLLNIVAQEAYQRGLRDAAAAMGEKENTA